VTASSASVRAATYAAAGVITWRRIAAMPSGSPITKSGCGELPS
jgi:hypothetical protein